MSAEGSRHIFSLSLRTQRIVARALLSLAALYMVFVLYRIPALRGEHESQATAEKISAERLTAADIDKGALPPVPDLAETNASVAGIDANHNDIRDDVELAIFAGYPNDEKVRAAELQYAMDLQMMLTGVTDSVTWKAGAIQEDRGYQCIGETFPRSDLDAYAKVTDGRTAEVEALVFNTAERLAMKEKIASFASSYQLPESNFCDIP